MARNKSAINEMDFLSLNTLCEPPPDQLTLEQRFAVHEFLHTVIAAGYKLYQVVPPDLARPIIKDKFGRMASFSKVANSTPPTQP